MTAPDHAAAARLVREYAAGRYMAHELFSEPTQTAEALLAQNAALVEALERIANGTVDGAPGVDYLGTNYTIRADHGQEWYANQLRDHARAALALARPKEETDAT